MKQEGRGNIYYGSHFYPGVCQYTGKDGNSYKVFLDEDTLRKMDVTFAGCPVFVHHVDEVNSDVNELRKDAEGWVVESFYNKNDGKHWSKFVVVTDQAIAAIKSGMKLSNCYEPTEYKPGGRWNGIDYEKQITNGVYEHLAIVPDPRYNESIIMTPDEFKKYNLDKELELKRLANSDNKDGEKTMFNWLKKTKVENDAGKELEAMSVVLPKSKKEVEIVKLINEADDVEVRMLSKEPIVAHHEHLVNVLGETMSVGELINKYEMMMDSDEEEGKEGDGEEKEIDPEKKKAMAKKEPEDKEEEKKDKETEKDEGKKEPEEKKENKKKNDFTNAKALALKNANEKNSAPAPVLMLTQDQLKRGQQMFGSAKN